MTELKEWLNSINSNKNNLIDEDPDMEKQYPSYIAVSYTHLTLPTKA